MQHKIVRPRPLADRFHRWAIRHGFPALLWLAPRVPRWFLHAGARLVIFLVFAVYRAPLVDVERNLARILGADASPRAVRRARRAMVRNLAYYWADLFRFAQLPAAAVQALVTESHGFDVLERVLAAGTGAILCTAHLGNWELGGALLGELAERVSVVYVPDKFGDVERFRSRLRGQSGVEEIPLRLDDQLGALPALRALRAKRILAVQGDRDFNDRGLPFPFFGGMVTFPPGPFVLAQLTGAPVIPTFIVYTEGHRFGVWMEEEIRVAPAAGRSAGERDPAVREAMAAWVAVLERAVRRWPTQWYTFYDFWPRDQAGAPAAAPEVGS